MKVIILGDELSGSYGFEIRVEWMLWLAAAVLSLISILVLSIFMAVDRGDEIDHATSKLAQIKEDLFFARYEMDEFYTYADSVFAEQAKQTGLLQARLSRLEALGQRLAHMADFDSEFDFSQAPALGGPEQLLLGTSFSKQADVLQVSMNLSHQLKRRESELKALESLLASQELHKEQYIAGKPVENGFLSSGFGNRIDPFTGRLTWHNGVDYTGNAGDPIKAVASGVVVWSGNRQDGYGQTVEVDNGDGFITRYSHNRRNLVNVGDVVSKGQVIAELGSTGRATGDHLHFEVYKKGRAVDPVQYIYRDAL